MLDLPAQRLDIAEAQALTGARGAGAAQGDSVVLPGRLGLAARVLIVAISSVLLALALFYSTRLAAYRETWLHNKLTTAYAVTEAFVPLNAAPISSDLAARILDAADVETINIVTQAGRRSIGDPSQSGTPMVVLDEGLFRSIGLALQTLYARPGSLLGVSYKRPSGEMIDVTLDETPLIEAMWRISQTFFTVSFIVAAVVTCVLWTALWHMVLRPVRRLTSNIIAFRESPQDISRVIAPSGRGDEIGRAETALAAMQNSLARELAQRKRLAELGLAVARINHDLRNMLSAAQLISDRLATIPDPLAQRLAPRLVATLDRAIQFCRATLTYGAGREQAPRRQRFDLNAMARQVVEAGEVEHDGAVVYHVEIPPQFELHADPDHILRVIENLMRNGAQALLAKGPRDGRPLAIRCAAIRTEDAALIEISDTGPGIPAEQTTRIFEPFHTSTSEAGTGLGLAIAAELVTRNGGSITLAPAKADDFYCGARFLIKLPTPERPARKVVRLVQED